MSCAWTSRAPRVKHGPSRDGSAGLSRMSAAAAGLFADVAVRPRNDLEPLVRDRVAADDRNAVCALLDPGLCPLDRLERLAQVLHESAVGAGLLELVGLIARILGLIGSASRVLLELLLDPRLLLSKSSARAFGVHGVDPIGNAPGSLRRCRRPGASAAVRSPSLPERKRVSLHPRIEDQREAVLRHGR